MTGSATVVETLNSMVEMSLGVGAAGPQQGGNHGNTTSVHLLAPVTLIQSVELLVLTYLLLTKEEGGRENSKATLRSATIYCNELHVTLNSLGAPPHHERPLASKP